MNNEITHAAIVPLIGGMTLGTMQALNGKLPEYIISYKAFAGNDSHFINHLRTKEGWSGDYVLLDDEVNESYKPTKQVDIVGTTCPCAGLSSLSVTSSADSLVNEWMYKTAEYTLKNLQPKVFWGENAPRLFTSSGKKVADRLYNIGQENGYSLNLYFTQSTLHGLAQKRPRTFYFFTKGDQTPIFKYYRRPMQPIEDILQMESSPEDSMNVLVNKENPSDNPWVAYCMYKSGSKTLKEYYDKIDESTNCIVQSDLISNNLLDVADWMDENEFPSKFSKRVRAMKQKTDDNKGYWAHGVTMPKGKIPSLIGVMPYSLINPYKNQFLTIRDCLRIMKMPENFDLYGENPLRSVNTICQNVPVSTAGDMASNILDYLNGNCDMANGTYLKQNNVSMKHDIIVKNESSLLESFFN